MQIKPVKYRGRRDRRGVIVEHQQVDGEAWFDLNPRLDIHAHSPQGFEWGYLGGGPAQLALALLASRTNPFVAWAFHRQFERYFVARLGETWEVDGVVIDFALAELRRAVATGATEEEEALASPPGT